jgi:hypothetical protein
MKYFLFLDESGDHGLTKPDPNFPVFVLCGVLATEENYEIIRLEINKLKESIWGDKKVIFHSRDIRKCEKEFQKLFDLELKKKFYEGINNIIAGSDYTIVASAIQKNPFIEKFGKLQDDVYEVALSFVIEQAVLILNETDSNAELSIVIERRGQKEDKQLDDHFQRLCARGTGKLTAEQLHDVSPTFTFRNKKENINGIQLADLVAYPIARYVIDPDRANPAFDILESKIYRTNGVLDGLKIYP